LRWAGLTERSTSAASWIPAEAQRQGTAKSIPLLPVSRSSGIISGGPARLVECLRRVKEDNMRRFLFASASALALLLTAGLGLAAADPANSPNEMELTLVCDHGQTYHLIAGAGSSGHIVESTGVVIPVAFGEVPIGNGKRIGQQNVLTTCTFLGESVTLFVTPRGPQPGPPD
jgi:hypothetical protein